MDEMFVEHVNHVFRRIGGLGIICWTEKDAFAIILG